MIGFSSARAIPAVLSIVFVGVLVRSLGVSNYAYFSLAAAVANTCASICAGWIAQGALRYLPGRPDRAESAAPALSVAVVLAALATVSTCVGGLAALLPDGVRGQLMLAICVLAAAMMYQSVWLARVMITGRSSLYAGSEIIRCAVVLGLALTLNVSGHLGLASAAWTFAGSYIAAVAFLHVFERLGISFKSRMGGSRAKAVRRAWLLRLWRFGSPMSLWLGLAVSLPLIDRAILLGRLGSEEAGTYAASYDIFFRIAALLFGPVLMVLHPQIMREVNTGRTDVARKWVHRSLAVALVVSPLVSLGVASAAPPVARLLGISVGGITFRLAFLITLGGCMWQTAFIAHKFLEMQHRTRLLLLCMISAIAVHAVLLLYLSAWAGLAGAAGAAILSGAMYCLLTLVFGYVRDSRVLT